MHATEDRKKWLESALPWEEIKRDYVRRCAGKMSTETVEIALEETYELYHAESLHISFEEFKSYAVNPPSKRAKESTGGNGNNSSGLGMNLIAIPRGSFRKFVEEWARKATGVLPNNNIGNALAELAGFSPYLYSTTISDLKKDGWTVEDHGGYFVVSEPMKRLPSTITPEEEEKLAQYLEYLRNKK